MMERSYRQETEAGARACDAEWARRRLVAAGFGAARARELAADSRIDLHELLLLTDRGCPARLALRIVWPLEEPARW